MIAEETIEAKTNAMSTSKVKDYIQLIKFRLSFLVVFSAVACFLLGTQGEINWMKMLMLVIGGFMVTGSSNAFNQIIERDLDKLMTRTQNRPLPDNRMAVNEAFVFSLIMGIIGVFLLTYFINITCGILGLFALLSYTLLYTPLKKQTPFAVFVGAFPGAIPPMLGWVAAKGQLDMIAFVLFFIQFIWQFPHFWAIAWVLDDDYKKAGFKMLPSLGGRNKASAFQALVYTISLIPISLLPFFFHITGIISAVVIIIAGVFFMLKAIKLYQTLTVEDGKALMFASFIYLPIIQIAMFLDKI
ncbi:MAG: heme o synthase [Bacteroidota bacterium]